jgi:hypothetical protein
MEMHVPVMFEAGLGMCYVYIMQCKVEHLVYLERARVWHACTNHCMPQSWGTHCMQQQIEPLAQMSRPTTFDCLVCQNEWYRLTHAQLSIYQANAAGKLCMWIQRKCAHIHGHYSLGNLSDDPDLLIRCASDSHCFLDQTRLKFKANSL